jgi:hypothetical protein
MKSISRFLIAACFAALVGSPQAALAYGDGTTDESPPAEESVCEDAGYMGAALGLCVAFCEANDCDVHSDDAACDRLRANYTRITGDLAFPCELDGSELPR